jgi:hypothetical protein
MFRTFLSWMLPLTLLVTAGCVSVEAPPPKPPPQTPDPNFTPPKGLAIPSGTRMVVRTWSTVDTRRHGAGYRFYALLESDLVVDDRVVAPRGSVVYGRVAQAQSAGRVVGRSSLTIEFTDLMIGSRLHPIRTTAIEAVSERSATGDTVGRTARAAAVGGLIGGSSGAKTGAKVGAGASLLTSGPQIALPEGTLLEFVLASAVTPS